MVVRVAGLPVWVGPGDLVAAARTMVGWTDDAVDLVAALPERVAGLLDDVGGLMGRVDGILGSVDEVLAGVGATMARVDRTITDVEATIRRAGQVAEGAAGVVTEASTVAQGAAGVVVEASTVAQGAAGVVTEAGAVADRAAVVVDGAEAASNSATALLELYRPMAERAAPLARRFIEEISEEELQAAIRMVDQLPQLLQHLENDVIPVLVTLDRVGPDVHELLNQLGEVRLAIQGIPGFALLRRRGERDEAETDG